MLLKSLLLDFEFLDVVLLLLLLFDKHSSLRLEDSELIICWCVLLKFLLETHTVSLQSLGIIGKSLELTLSSHWLLKKHLDSLESFSLVIKLSSQNLVVKFSVLSCLVSKVFQHLVRAKVLARHLLDVHHSLLDGKHLLLIELNHVCKFSLLFVQLRILLLLLSKLRSCFEKCMEILFVALVFE